MHPLRLKLLLPVVAALLLPAASCRLKTAGKAPGKSAPNVTAECVSGGTIVSGPYKYENNQWGSGKVHGSFEQCLLTRTREGRTEYGWSWDFPGVDTSVFAYPEIIFGWKPWSGGASTDARFPMRVSDIKQLSIVYDVETEASGHYNLAPEVWLTRTRTQSNAANPSLITAEIMFWVEAAGQARPAGSIVDRPTLGGRTYELWKMEGAGDQAAGQRWTLFSFKIPEVERKGTIPVHDLLSYMVGSNQIDPNQYVASVEFGNEISGGRGTTWVRRFEVDVKP